ncbi:uncharacterized protein C8Q71DRAFT_230181 [Rhodofomes roseus]|uniref:Uncharacterized protein n=1 Tax=Rhodofomes roseus TaxID=34475 RepID=A0ABQ8KVV4_9APHY|nr:uncharacterized protein C8Q71DRAFT_230181 [Rhodofomes roseus]KAH9842982.1 hypothetical protein C8Q71DRAFT_230181 [Rhodofomes roseus]
MPPKRKRADAGVSEAGSTSTRATRSSTRATRSRAATDETEGTPGTDSLGSVETAPQAKRVRKTTTKAAAARTSAKPKVPPDTQEVISGPPSELFMANYVHSSHEPTSGKYCLLSPFCRVGSEASNSIRLIPTTLVPAEFSLELGQQFSLCCHVAALTVHAHIIPSVLHSSQRRPQYTGGNIDHSCDTRKTCETFRTGSILRCVCHITL